MNSAAALNRVTSQADHSPDQTNAHTSNGQDHKGQNQGIGRNRPGVAGNPCHGAGDDRSHVVQNGADGSSISSLLKHSFPQLYMYHPANKPGHNEQNTKAGKGRNGRRKQKVRQLHKEPGNKLHHSLRSKAPPNRNVQKTSRTNRAAEAHHT